MTPQERVALALWVWWYAGGGAGRRDGPCPSEEARKADREADASDDDEEG